MNSSFNRLTLVVSAILISAILIWITQGGIIDMMLYPLRVAMSNTQNWVHYQQEVYATNEATRLHLKDVELQNASLSREVARMKEIELENDRLRNLMLLPLEDNKDNYQYVTARIIERSPNSWYETFIIDKGSKDNISVDDVVSGPSGIIGKVTKVSGEHSALVMSLSDIHNSISLINSRSRDVIIAQGAKENKLKSKILYARADMQAGDIMLSSGLGTIYPRYVPVARITKITKEDIEPLPVIEMELLGYDKYWEQVIVFTHKK